MPNHETTTPTTEIEEQERTRSEEELRRVGAKVLTSIGFQNREIVGSSMAKADKNKEKLPGSPAERRNLAHLRRLERMIERRGTGVEQRIWAKAKEHITLISADTISDSAWRAIQHEEQANGGNPEGQSKEEVVERYVKAQNDSLQSYVDYFSSEECTFPTWFKVYAWDGLTRLSKDTVRNPKTGQSYYKKRDKKTVTGFPKLDPEALSLLYEDLARHFGTEQQSSSSDTNETLTQLIKSGNFSQLYSYECSALGRQIEVPTNPEDVRGEWQEYGYDDAEKIADAAYGTPWCVKDANVARNYMANSRYGSLTEEERPDGATGKFVFFHLVDPSTGLPSRRACASLRFDASGKIAEISGKYEQNPTDQTVDPSLLPTIREKMQQIAGSEEKLKAVDACLDVARLIFKLQSGEQLSSEELESIFKPRQDAPNERLNHATGPQQYRDIIREKLIPLILKTGTPPEELLKYIPLQVAEYIPEFLESGLDASIIAGMLIPEQLLDNLDKLIPAGAAIDVNAIAQELDPRVAAKKILAVVAKTDEKIDLNIDADAIIQTLSPIEILENLDSISKLGKTVNLRMLSEHLEPRAILEHLQIFKDAKIDINLESLIGALGPAIIVENLQTLIDEKVPINFAAIFDFLHSNDVIKYLKDISESGIDTNSIVEKIFENIGYAISEESLANLFATNNTELIDAFFEKAENWDIQIYLDEILKYKDQINVEKLLSRFTPREICFKLSIIRDAGIEINIDKLVASLNDYDILEFYGELSKSGTKIDIQQILDRADPEDIIDNIDALQEAHIDISIDELLPRLDPQVVAEERDGLIEYGATPEVVDAIIAKYNAEHTET